METGAAAVGLVAGVGSVITIVSKSILSLNTARLKFSEADLSVELLVGQLYTVRTALNQVQAFVQESFGYDEQHEDFATDLCVAVEHCKLLVQHIDDQISRLDWLPGEHLQTRGKARLLLEERILRDNIQLLNSQMSGINLCVTAFKARPSSPSKEPLERVKISYREEAIVDDTASGQLAANLMSFPPPSNLRPVSRSGPRLSFIKRFDLDRLSLKAPFYEHGFRSLSRSSSHGTEEAQEQSPATIKPSMLKLSNSMAQSARVDSLIRRDADRRWRNIKMLAVGQRPTTTMRRLQYAMAAAPSREEIEECRRIIVSSAIKALLALVEHVGNTVALFEIVKRQADIYTLESFLADGAPDWDVTSDIRSAAMSLWLSPRVQEYYKAKTQEASAGYFLRATERLLQVDYEPTLTDMIKIGARKDAATESRITVDDIVVNIIDAPQPKLNRLIKHFEDADAYLLSLDLSSYDEYVDSHDVNLLETSIKAIGRRWKISRRDKPVLLVLYHAAAFNRKLAKSALSNHFPDYRGKDFSSAKDYVLQRCRGALNHEQALFHHFSDDDAEDTAIVDFFKKTVVELPHLIACVRNLEQYLGLGSPTIVERYRKRTKKPSMQLRASF